MKTEDYQAAIVGMGGISAVHAKSLLDLSIPIAAVCDNKPDIAKAAGEQYNCTPYTDYMTMISDGGFDVLHICLPHYLHAPAAIAALEKGIHVVCEKPMATTVADAEAMIVAAQKSGAKLEIIFQNRYNAGSQLIKTTLDSGELGRILGGWLRVTWYRGEEYYTGSDWRGRWATEGGGALINQSIHTFDLMNYFLGNPTSVNASIANRAHPYIEVEDMAEGLITYSDVNVSFFVNTYHPYNAPVSLEIICEHGQVALSGDTATITYKDGRVVTSDARSNEKLYGKSYWGYSHVVQIQAFYDMLAGKTAETVCGAEGMRTQLLVNGIYDSAKLGEMIAL